LGEKPGPARILLSLAVTARAVADLLTIGGHLLESSWRSKEFS